MDWLNSSNAAYGTVGLSPDTANSDSLAEWRRVARKGRAGFRRRGPNAPQLSVQRGSRFHFGGWLVANILIAASSEPRAILERILSGHNLSCQETLAKAEEMLRNRPFDLIVCTVFFDESRMFDLLRLARSTPEWQRIPFVCARLRRHVLEASVAREAMAFACKSLGAVAFVDVANYPADTDGQLRAAIERYLNTR